MQNGMFSENMSRGYAGLAQRSVTNVNPKNPASYTGLYFTTFDLGLHAISSSLNDENASQTVSGAGVSYLNLAFPATPYLAFSGGIMPYSQVDYTVNESRQNGELGTENLQYNGYGSIYKFYGGASVKYKSLSVGFNMGYYFGNQNHSLLTEYPDKSEDIANFLQTLRSEKNQFGGLQFDFGALYDFKINETTNISVGAVYKPKQNLNLSSDSNWQRVLPSSSTDQVFNTDSTIIFDLNSTESVISLAQEWGIGIDLYSEKGWTFSADIRNEHWSDALLNRIQQEQLQNRSIFSLGTSIIPNANKEGGNTFWKRVQYRFGFYYDSYNLKINDTSVPSYGVTLGFGFPLRGKPEAGLLDSGVPYSRLNLSFDLGQKGTTDNQLVQETYFKMTLGFSMNSKWFVKRRYD